jgi:hypothetical protein
MGTVAKQGGVGERYLEQLQNKVGLVISFFFLLYLQVEASGKDTRGCVGIVRDVGFRDRRDVTGLSQRSPWQTHVRKIPPPHKQKKKQKKTKQKQRRKDK